MSSKSFQIDKISISKSDLWQASQQADTNQNHWIGDEGDRPLIVHQSGSDLYVPITAKTYQLVNSQWREYESAHQKMAASWPHDFVEISVLRPVDGIKIITKEIIQDLRLAQAGQSIALSHLIAIYPEARFAKGGPTLKEIGDTLMPDGRPMRELFFDLSGALIANTTFDSFLKSNAPTLAVFHSSGESQDPTCATSKGFELPACHPDSRPLDFLPLMAHSTLVMDMSNAAVNETNREMFIVVRKALIEAAPTNPCVSIDGDKISINLRNPGEMRQLLAYLDQSIFKLTNNDGEEKSIELHCNPQSSLDMAFYMRVPPENITNPPSDNNIRMALIGFMGTLLNKATKIEFKEDDAATPARFNKWAGRATVIAQAVIPLSYLQKGVLNRAVYFYGLLSPQSYGASGNHVDNSILTNEDHHFLHAGDHESVFGEVEWALSRFYERGGDFSASLKRTILGAGEHGSRVPIDLTYFNGVISQAYGSGALAAMQNLNDQLIHLTRTGITGVLARGTSTIISDLDFLVGRRGINGYEAFPTRQALVERHTATLLRPAVFNPNGFDYIPTVYGDLPSELEGAEQKPYQLRIGGNGDTPLAPTRLNVDIGKNATLTKTDRGEQIEKLLEAPTKHQMGGNMVLSLEQSTPLLSGGFSLSVGVRQNVYNVIGSLTKMPFEIYFVHPFSPEAWQIPDVALTYSQHQAGSKSVLFEQNLMRLAPHFAMWKGAEFVIDVSGGYAVSLQFKENEKVKVRPEVFYRLAAGMDFHVGEASSFQVGVDFRQGSNSVLDTSDLRTYNLGIYLRFAGRIPTTGLYRHTPQ